jgi:outer membrane lipoprotein-sorting protein
MIKRLFLLTIIALLQCAAAQAQNETPNARQARRIFNQVYDKVFGQQGSTLTYDVNIIGIYKTHGTIWMKGKKQKFVDEKVNTWNDGTTAYMCYRKRKTVEIHHANSDKKDKYSGRFKFSLDDFNYSIAKDPEGLLITLKQKKKAKGTIKEVRALISEPELEPVRLRIKVAFFWTTVNISNFKSGGITDDLFVFPRKNYQEGWKFVDKRKD